MRCGLTALAIAAAQVLACSRSSSVPARANQRQGGHIGGPPAKLARNMNNVGGQMPSPAGSTTIVLLGTFASHDECAKAAAAKPSSTSWTYHHCDFPPARSGNYSCHCYARTDGVWHPAAQELIDSGFLHDVPSPKSFHCSSNTDCQLNGRCSHEGECVCDAAWRGERCQELDLLPGEEGAGLQDPVLSSWGGSVLQDPTDSTWHMYVAVIENGCGLKAWRPNSAIGHATAASVEGPYTLEAQLIKPHFAHEPVAVIAPDNTLLIYHIGAGHNDTGAESNYAHNCSGRCTGGGHHWQPGTTFYGPTSILHAKSFHGPWSSLDIGNCSDLPRCSQCGDTNPAPVVRPDGSVGLMWRASGAGWPTSCMVGASAPAWRGPYTWNTTNLFPTYTHTHIEDAHQWVAPPSAANPGSYHAVFHSDVEKKCGGAAGGHAYSRDGVSWVFSPYNAFGNVVQLRNGSSLKLRQRERPHVVLDQAGNPVALTSGAGWEDDCDHVFTFSQLINHTVRPDSRAGL